MLTETLFCPTLSLDSHSTEKDVSEVSSTPWRAEKSRSLASSRMALLLSVVIMMKSACSLQVGEGNLAHLFLLPARNGHSD